MAELYTHKNAVYECVDENPESISGSSANDNAAFLYFTVSTCNGLPCPPYVNKRAITCVVYQVIMNNLYMTDSLA